MATEPAPAARAAPWIKRGGAVLLGLALGWMIVPASLSDLAVSRNNPRLAVAMHPTADALSMAGAEALKANRIDDAVRLARASLDRSPFNVVALRVIGLAQETRDPGDGRAAGYMALAGRLGWRDTPTQLWYVRTATQLGEYEIAMQRADALMRIASYGNEVAGFMRAAATDERALPSILMRLVEKPRWRAQLFRGSNIDAQQRDGLDRLIEALAQSSAPMTRDEVAPYLAMLVNEGELARADRVTRIAFGGGKGWPNDPRFLQAARLSMDSSPTLPFEWQFNAPPGINTRFVDGGGIIVEIDARKRGKALEQWIRLAPGSYRLSTSIAGNQPKAASLLRWGLLCQPSRGSVAEEPAQATTSGETTLLTMDFTVPAETCDAQRLALTAGSGSLSTKTEFLLKEVAIAPR